jgi:uncharacterized protein
MVLPIGFYRDAFQTIDALKPAGVSVRHSFQTNGMLIDDAWCDFMLEAEIGIGVSIDGPKHLHDRNRLTRSGRGTFDRTIAGIRRLRRRGVPFHVISVLSSLSMKSPAEMFDFYVSEGIEEVCFNVEESEGSHVSSTFAQDDVDAVFYRFMSEFWRLSAASPGKVTFIREVDHAIQQVLRPRDAMTANQLIEPFAVTCMDFDVLARAPWPEEHRLWRFPARQYQYQPAGRSAGASKSRQHAARHPRRRRAVPAALPVF